MVRRLFETLATPVRGLARPIEGLHQAAYLLAAFTLASQVLALLRDRLFAHNFGAGEILDLYYGAFKVPDLVFALVASLVSAYVLIPRIAGGNAQESRALLSQATSFLLIGGGILALILAFVAPHLLFFAYPSFAASPHAADFVFLSRILLIQPILLGLSGIATSVTQVHRRFLLFALSPVLYNLGIIGGTLFLYPSWGLPGIGVGVILGAVAHLLIHLPVVSSAGLFPRLVVPSAASIWSIARDSIPRSLALGMGSAVAFILTALVARTGEGGVSVFTLAGNLEAVPLSLIGASYATAAFPVLAAHAGADRQEAFRETVSTAARHLIFWSTVVALLTIVLRAHIVRVAFGSGAFDWDDTRLTAAVLAVLVIGLTAQGLILLASRAFYAAYRSWNPLFIQLVGAALSVATALGVMHLSESVPTIRWFMEALLRIEDVPGSAAVFIAFGATLGQLLMGMLALATLHVVAPGVARTLIRPLLEGLGAGIVGAAAAYATLTVVGTLAPLSTLMNVLAEGAIAGTVGFAAAAGVLFLLENREFRDLSASLKKLAVSKLPPLSAF